MSEKREKITAKASALQLQAAKKSFFRRFRFLAHPVFVFVGLQIVWVAVTVIWVVWFVSRQEELAKLAKLFGPQNTQSSTALGTLVVGCILLGVIMVGTILLFVFGQRQSYAIRQQRSFLSSVTHELRSPLSSLQLAFETLVAREVEPQVRQKLLGMGLVDIERLVRLVDQILVSARLDRGIVMFEDKGETLCLYDVVQAVGESSSYLDRSLPERLQIDCSRELYVFMSRPVLSLILGNLIENSVKYSPPGSKITVAASTQNHKLLIKVIDRGFGLEKKERKRIFKMFHRSETATKKAIAGTGLGLFIVKSAVGILGGRVWAESEGLGKGSTFCVEFPAKPTEWEGRAGIYSLTGSM